MKTELLVGQEKLTIQVPEGIRILDMKPLPSLPDPTASVREALNDPIGAPPLSEIAKGRKNACIVISDITRPVPNKVILPPLLQTLEKSGVMRDQITILVATGMHRPNLGEELEFIVGREIMDNYRIVNHYCRRSEELKKVDEIEGAPIVINKHYAEADLKILTGLIEPHFYAGYSGGRKSILPGISSFETMKFMHSFNMIDHPKVTNCILDGNPFHEYGIRVAEIVGVDFILNVVINKQREVAGVFAGHFDRAHRAGCELVAKHSIVELNEYVDVVITSGGGFPLDATFYQMSKPLICARDILNKGGTIILACECREGLGSQEFCNVLHSVCTPREFFGRYCDPDNFVIDQWCAQNIYQALDHAGKVYVYSPGLTKEDLAKIGIEKVDDLQATVDRVLSANPKAVVVPEGPYVVAMVR